MKEKLKKIFTCKDLWNYVLEIICGIILLFGGYFSGFANGLFIEDDIRDNMIVEINELINEDKNKKLDIKIEKKESIDLPYTYTYTYENLNMPFFVQFAAEETGSFLGRQGIMSFDLSFDFLIYSSDNIVVNNISMLNFELGQSQYSSSGDNFIFDFYISMFNYSLPIELIKVDNELFSFGFNDNVSFSFPYFYIDELSRPFFYIDFFINDNVFTSYFNQTFLFQIVENVGTEFFVYFLVAFDKNGSKPYPIYSLNNTFNSLLTEIFAQENGGASQEELEQAYQNGINVGYQSGVIEGVAEYKTSQEYKDELKEEYNKGKDDGYDIGYQARQDSVEDSEQTINSIWSILEKAITSTLNVLSFEILPGIPLYICIAVPILLCILLWVIKVGAS